MDQQIINWLFAGFGAAVGWILKVVWDAIRDLNDALRAFAPEETHLQEEVDLLRIVDMVTRSVRFYAKRGMNLTIDRSEDVLPLIKVRSHYLGFTIHGKLGVHVGPATAYLVAGPTVEQLLDTGCSSDLCGVIVEEGPTNLGLTVGPGLGVSFSGGYRLEAEALLTEGLTEAYRSATSGIRYRSLEFLLRFAVPF